MGIIITPEGRRDCVASARPCLTQYQLLPLRDRFGAQPADRAAISSIHTPDFEELLRCGPLGDPGARVGCDAVPIDTDARSLTLLEYAVSMHLTGRAVHQALTEKRETFDACSCYRDARIQ